LRDNEDIKNFIEEENLGRDTIIFGHSYGGTITMKFLLDYPQYPIKNENNQPDSLRIIMVKYHGLTTKYLLTGLAFKLSSLRAANLAMNGIL